MAHLINITEAASLALHSMALIATESPKKLSSKYLAKKLDASEAHLAKILQRLSKSGLLKSYRGPKGGFLLAKPPKDINFLEIYEIVESTVKVEHCPLHKKSCPFKKCIFNDALEHISREIYNVFTNIKLSDFKS